MDRYRISSKSLRTQAAIFGVMAAIFAGYFGYRAWMDQSDRIGSLVIALFVLGLMVYYFARAHRRTISLSREHSLELTADAVVLRDGPTSRRIPYEGVEKMTVKKPLVGDRWFLLKVRGLEPERFYGYEDIDALISNLMARLPREVVSARLHSA